MSTIAIAFSPSSSALNFSSSSRESRTSLFHYNGLRSAEAAQLGLASFDINGLVATKGAPFLDSVVLCLISAKIFDILAEFSVVMCCDHC